MLFVAGAITKGITITNLPINSRQADEKIIEVLRGCGVEINITEYPKYWLCVAIFLALLRVTIQLN